MPNFASLYQVGGSYFCRDSQSGRKGPCCPTRSTSSRMAARAVSNFDEACCQMWSNTAGSSDAVGALGEWGACEWATEQKMMHAATAIPTTMRLGTNRQVGEKDMKILSRSEHP